jgi:hypothetical protein
MNNTPSVPVIRQMLVHHVVLARTLHEVHPRHLLITGGTGTPVTV